MDDYIVWKIGDQVSATNAAEVRETVLATHKTYTRHGMPRINETVTIFVYHDPDALETAAKEAAGWTVDAADIDPMSSGMINGRATVLINTSSERFRDWSLKDRQRQIVVHMVRLYNSLMSALSTGAASDEVPPAGPQWLEEGVAEYFTRQTLRAGGTEPCDKLNGGTQVSSGELLSDMETWQGYSATKGTGQLTFLAAKQLAERAGPQSLVAYYASLEPGTAWQETFQTTFGMTVDEFYELFEKHHANVSPYVDYSATTPEEFDQLLSDPSLPSYIRWVILGDVDPREVELVVEGVRVFDEFRESRRMPVPTKPVVIYMDSDVDRIVCEVMSRYGWTHEIMRKYWEDRWVAVDDQITIHAVAPGEPWTSDSKVGGVVHELVHAALQNRLIGALTEFEEFEYSNVLDEPRWLAEGMAHYITHLATSEYYDNGQFPKNRDRYVSLTLAYDIPLRDAETHPSNLPAGVTLQYDREEIIDCTYKCGAAAFEILASRVGIEKLPHYWMLLEPRMVAGGRRGRLWPEAFERAYGVTVEEFYKLFEEHRAAGFPEVEIPR